MITQTISSETEAAAEMLRRGGLVAVPTETVYGLAGTDWMKPSLKRYIKSRDALPSNQSP